MKLSFFEVFDVNMLKQAFSLHEGTVPVVLTAVHGGKWTPNEIPNKTAGVIVIEQKVDVIVEKISALCKQSSYQFCQKEIDPYTIIVHLAREKIDLNRPDNSPEAYHPASTLARNIHQQFWNSLHWLLMQASSTYPALWLDVHGFNPKNDTHAARQADIILGTVQNVTISPPTLFGKQSTYYPGKSEIYAIMINDPFNFVLYPHALDVNEYSQLQGGPLLRHFGKNTRINAIQLEISKKIRQNRSRQNHLIQALSKVIIHYLMNLEKNS